MSDANATPTEARTDRIDPARAAALIAALGLEQTPPESGQALPPMAQRLYFWDTTPDVDLAEDGLPPPGQGVWPADRPAPRRLIGGRVIRHAPFAAGVAAERITRHAEVRGQGGAGRVTLRHEVRQRGVPVLSEEETFHCGGALPPAPVLSDGGRFLGHRRITAGLIIRYAGLTWNGPVAAGVEGAPADLPATLLALAAGEGVRRFAWSSHGVLAVGDLAELRGAGGQLWVLGRDGAVICRAVAD